MSVYSLWLGHSPVTSSAFSGTGKGATRGCSPSGKRYGKVGIMTSTFLKGIRNKQTFVAANSLLAGALFVAAQLWASSIHAISVYTPEIPGGRIEVLIPRAEFGLAWVYVAGLFALGALAVATIPRRWRERQDTPPAALALFAAALEHAGLYVGQSLISSVRRLALFNDYASIQGALSSITSEAVKPLPNCLLFAGLVFVLALLLLCWIGVAPWDRLHSHARWRVRNLPWLVNGVNVLMFGIAVFYIYNCTWSVVSMVVSGLTIVAILSTITRYKLWSLPFEGSSF